MSVLVTGGSGFVGRNLQLYKPDWHFISSRDADLTNPKHCDKLFELYQPDAVVHLAGIVGGIKENAAKQAEFFTKNVLINTNVMNAAAARGVNRLLSCLSTCAFPDVVEVYPFTEGDIFKGPPAETNFSYGYAKRMLHVQSLAYRKEAGLNYSTFCPSNLYGPFDDFSEHRSHFVGSLIRRLAGPKNTITLWGTGKPLRQQLYVDDLCQIIPMLLEKHNSDIPIIVAPNENLSIRQMALEGLKLFEKDVKLEFNNNLDGQYRKDGSNKELLKLIGDFEFTTFKDGLRKTYDWYVSNKKE